MYGETGSDQWHRPARSQPSSFTSSAKMSKSATGANTCLRSIVGAFRTSSTVTRSVIVRRGSPSGRSSAGGSRKCVESPGSSRSTIRLE